jgi:hypothetical protein
MIDQYQMLLFQIELLKDEGNEIQEIHPERVKKELDSLFGEAVDFADILRDLAKNDQQITI